MSSTLTRVSRFGLVNAFLVHESDGLTLVDTTLPRSGEAILRAAAPLEAPIVRILLTHAHGDHVGALDELVDALPGVEVAISARDARLLAGDRTPAPGDPAQGKLRGGYPGTRTRPDRLLAAGDRVGSLEVLAAPGHTPGHVAFLDIRDRTLICGDAYSTLGGVSTTAVVNPRFPLPGLATWDRPTALRSARDLVSLAPSRLAAGHGRIVEDPVAAMEAAVARAE